MTANEISIINELLKKSVEDIVTWKMTSPPTILYATTELTIVSCYIAYGINNSSGKLYLVKYRVPEYLGEYDKFFNLEKVGLALINNDQITWQSINDSIPAHNLYEYVSNKYSGIENIFNI